MLIRSLQAPTWELPLVLQALSKPPYEPLATADVKLLSLKTAFVLPTTLCALSISPDFLCWRPEDSKVVLQTNPALWPTVVTSFHVSQPIVIVCHGRTNGCALTA